MRATLARTGAAIVCAVLLSPAAATAAPDRTVKVDGNAPLAKWDGAAALGVNQTFTLYEELPIKIGQCGKLPINMCEDTVVQADAGDTSGAKLRITIDGFGAVLPPANPLEISIFDDFDVFIFKSDATGKVGDFAGTGGEGAGVGESVTIENASGFYLVRVVYYATFEAGYKGTAELLGVPNKTGSVLIPTTAPPPPPNPPSGSPQQQNPPPGGSPQQQQPPANAPSGNKPQTLPVSGPLRISFAADSGKRKTARKRGARVRLSCSVQCKATAVATVSKKVAKALKLKGKKKVLKLGRGKATITRAGRIPFFVKLNKKAKRALARKKVKKFKVKMVITVRNLSGKQIKRGKKTITLR